MIEDHEDSPGPRSTSETSITGNKSILGDELCTAMHVDMPVTCSQHIATFVGVSDIYARKKEADS
jgi:hypothetical protein